jgi:cytochrome c-type biogenesis protein CcmH
VQGGRLAGKPHELIDRALALDAAHPRALEMAGSAAYEAGDFRGAARHWKQLLTLLPANSTEHAQLAAAIARAEQRAKFTLPSS